MNKEEFESCYNRHFDFVYRLSFTYVKNPADAEDVAQETFVRLYRQEGEFTSEEHVKRWLLRVAVNLSKDYLRSRWNQKRQEFDENIPEEIFGWQEDQKEIWQEVAALPESIVWCCIFIIMRDTVCVKSDRYCGAALRQ